MSVDWRLVINDLQRAGLSIQQQAREAGVTSHRTVINWREGLNEPRYSAGERLISVYRTVVGST